MIWLALFASLSAHAAPLGDFLADLDLFKQRSLLIRTDREALSAASSSRLSHLFQFTPRVTLAGGHEASGGDASQQLYQPTVRDWYWRGGVEWNLFHGGSDFFAWRSARQSEASASFTVKAQELKTELDGANAIFRRLYLRDYQAAQSELLQLKQETLRIGRSRFDAGKISLQDVVKMEVDLSQQQNLVRQTEIDQAENEAVFRSFFVDSLQSKDWPFTGKESSAAPPSGQALSYQQLSFRRAADASDLLWRSSVTKHLPSIDLNASTKKYFLDPQNLRTWSASIELSIPFWSRWEIAADNAAARAASVKAQDEADQNARDEELRRGFLQKKVKLSRVSLEEARANLDRADHLYRDMLHSFELGRLTTNDLFIEQDRKIKTHLDYAQSRMDFHSSVIESCVLQGLSAAECLK